MWVEVWVRPFWVHGAISTFSVQMISVPPKVTVKLIEIGRGHIAGNFYRIFDYFYLVRAKSVPAVNDMTCALLAKIILLCRIASLMTFLLAQLNS